MSIQIDGWSKAYSNVKCNALLINTPRTDLHNAQTWLVALNEEAPDGTAEKLREWVLEQLDLIGLGDRPVDTMVADNASVNTKLSTLLGCRFIGCHSHKLNLLVQDAWHVIQHDWPSKVAKIIGNFNKSPKLASTLKQHQQSTGKAVLKLLDWNDTRWSGKFTALIRFCAVAEDRRSREIINCDLTDEELQCIKDTVAILEPIHALTETWSGENKGTGISHRANYGEHYRKLHSIFLDIICAMTMIPWDNRSTAHRKLTWKFCLELLKGFKSRFFTDIDNDVILGYYLSRQSGFEFGFIDNMPIITIFTSCSRNPSSNLLPGSDLNTDLIWSTPPVKMTEDTVITHSAVVAHLKCVVDEVYNDWKLNRFTPSIIHRLLDEWLQNQATLVLPADERDFTSTDGVVEDYYMKLRRRMSGSATDQIYDNLQAEMTRFEQIAASSTKFNSYEWAFREESIAFPNIRVAIQTILSQRYTSVDAEQAFSCAKFQTSQWSSSLNSLDYETRLTLAFNRRNYTDSEFERLMGWAPFLLPSSNSRIVMDDIMVAHGCCYRRSQQEKY